MSEKGKIKVIKKDEIKSVQAPPKKELRTKREAAREMVSNVSSWVSDFQVRKREETKVAIEKFFGGNPRPSES